MNYQETLNVLNEVYEDETGMYSNDIAKNWLESQEIDWNHASQYNFDDIEVFYIGENEFEINLV